jgi:hypothetical protein
MKLRILLLVSLLALLAAPVASAASWNNGFAGL